MGILLSQIVLAKQQNFWIFLTETTIRFVERWKAKGKKAMRWEGLMPELITSNPVCLLKLCLAMMKSFCYLPYYFTFCNYDIGSGKGCPDPAFPLLSRESRIPYFCHRHPGCRFLSKSRICAHLTFPESRTVFWSNSGILVIPCILDVNLIALFFS